MPTEKYSATSLSATQCSGAPLRSSMKYHTYELAGIAGRLVSVWRQLHEVLEQLCAGASRRTCRCDATLHALDPKTKLNRSSLLVCLPCRLASGNK